MKTDQNSNMQGTLNKRISMKKRRNAKRALLALNLVAVIFTTTVFSNPVSVLSEEVSTDAVQSIENSPGTDAQIAEQADVQQNTAEAAQAAEAPAEEDMEAEVPSSAAMPAVTFDQKVNTENGTVMVHVDAEEGAFEDGTSMAVTPVTRQDILDKAIDAAGGKGAAAAMDITFTKPNGTKTEPLKPIHVKMISPVLNRAEEAYVVHVTDSGSTDVVAKKSDGKTIESTSNDATSSDGKNAVSFESDSFSVYAIVYTVDFEYEVDGKIYKYNMPGGGYVSLSKLVEVLGVLDGAKHADAADFMAEVDHLEFSNPELVWVEKVDTETTVGNLKEQNGLHVEYSAELTNEQIEEINAQTLKAGDWALISMQPFDSAETLTVTMKDGDEFTIQLTDSQTTINSATVHYGYMVGNTFHEFNTEQFSPPTSGFGNPAYLIYDVPGYQYAGTTYYRSSANTNMSYASTVNPTINNYSSGHYYVTYEPRPTATQGGDSSTAEAYPEEPTVTKSSTENPNTGTNTISLEVEGKRNTVKSKADIIVIYDVSGSMNFPLDFNSETDIPAGGYGPDYFLPDGNPNQRHTATKNELQKLANELMAGQTGNDPAVRMSIVPFSTVDNSPTAFTGNPNTFNQNLNSLTLGGGTNWEAALQAANAMQVREDADTYVLFLTDGNPTFRITRGNESDSLLTGYRATINGRTYNLSGINTSFYNPYGIFGTGNTDWDKTTPESLISNYDAALAIAQAIVDKDKKLYGIGISSEAGRLQRLIQESNGGGKYYEATSASDMEHAINDIKNQIKELTFGYSDVQITDGITALTQTVQKTGMTTLPDSDDFEYFKGHAATQADVDAGKATTVGETVWEPWTAEQMAQEGAGRASYDSTTDAVVWNLGDKFMLEDGVKYKVDFTVWPSQDAYDLLADLNNGVKDYDSLEESVRKQIKKQGEGESATYTLKTNRDDEYDDPAGYTYKKATKEGEDGEVTPTGDPIPGKFDPVIPLNLRTDKIGVKKAFSNLLDSRDPTQISLELWGNRLYKTFTLTKDGQWKSDDNYISCGLLTVDKETGKLYVYETGHDFTLKETGEDSIYWELTADTYHPMVINNVLHMLSKVDAPDGMTENVKYFTAGGKEYYRIGNNVYVDEGTDAVLNATNDHRSFLDLSKEVVNDAGTSIACNDYFNYKIKFNESRTEDDIIFTVYDTVNKQYINDQNITTAVLTPADDATNTRPYFKVANKTEFTLKIKQGWNVRFLNLSNDTTYSIEEVLGETSKYEFVKVEGSAVKTVKNNTDGTTSTVQVDTHMTITEGQTKMTGTIGEPNVLYSVKYTNKPLKGSLKIKKLVTVEGNAPESADDKELVDGDYIFVVNSGGDVTPAITKYVQITVTDGVAAAYKIADTEEGLAGATSVTGNWAIVNNLPEGEYTVTEIGKNGLMLVAIARGDTDESVVDLDNSKVTLQVVSGDSDAEEDSAQATFTNNYTETEGPDKKALDIEKIFSGFASAADIPQNFNVVVEYTVGNDRKEIVLSKGQNETTSDGIKIVDEGEGLDLSWHITNIPSEATSFRIKESNYRNVPDYDFVTATLNGTDITETAGDWHTVAITTPTVTSQNVTEQRTASTSSSNVEFVLENDDIFLIKLTSNRGTMVVSKRALNETRKSAIENNWPDESNFPKNHVVYFSMEDHLEGFTYDKKTLAFSTRTGDGKALVSYSSNSNSPREIFALTYGSDAQLKEAVITNTYSVKEVPLKIVKVRQDNSEIKIDGAQFTIRKLKETLGASDVDYDGPESDPITTDDEGEASFTNITKGFYEIRETKVPSGYVVTGDKCFYIKVENGVISLLEKDLTKRDLNDWIATKTEVGNVTFTAASGNTAAIAQVGNEPGAALPNTGGVGTTMLYIIGALLIIGAGTVLAIRRRMI